MWVGIQPGKGRCRDWGLRPASPEQVQGTIACPGPGPLAPGVWCWLFSPECTLPSAGAAQLRLSESRAGPATLSVTCPCHPECDVPRQLPPSRQASLAGQGGPPSSGSWAVDMRASRAGSSSPAPLCGGWGKVSLPCLQRQAFGSGDRGTTQPRVGRGGLAGSG